DKTWERLADKAPDGVRVGTDLVSLADLKKTLDRSSRQNPEAIDDWLLFRGQANRSGHTTGTLPVLEASWQRSTVTDPTVQAWLDEAVHQMETSKSPVLPATYPIATAGTVVFR